MGVLGQYGGPALKYWGSILASAEQHLSVSDMWQSIRGLQQQYGLPAPGVTAPDVMVLRGYANKLVAGQAALEAAAPGDTITAAMTGIGPYTSSDLAGLAAEPTYMVTFSNQVQKSDGSIVEAWQTTFFTAANMPQTVSDLQDSVAFTAQQLAAQGSENSTGSPPGISLGVSSLRITVV